MRVLITGDDGPPSSVSPYVLGLYLELRKLGWEVCVVIPSSREKQTYKNAQDVFG